MRGESPGPPSSHSKVVLASPGHGSPPAGVAVWFHLPTSTSISLSAAVQHSQGCCSSVRRWTCRMRPTASASTAATPPTAPTTSSTPTTETLPRLPNEHRQRRVETLTRCRALQPALHRKDQRGRQQDRGPLEVRPEKRLEDRLRPGLHRAAPGSVGPAAG